MLFTAFSLTTAINEWSSVLYSIIYSAVPTIVVGVLDKDLSKRTLLKHPQLYGAGLRQEAYNKKLFWLSMADTLWQSIAVFFTPLIAYWGTTEDVASIGDLWTLSVVILVNLHYSRMLTNMCYIVTNVRGWEGFLEEMKCLCRILWRLKSLIVGE